MKHQNYFFKKTSLPFFMMIMLSLFFTSTMQAQHGPTLVISSNSTGNDYVGSKNNSFNINSGAGNTGYRLIKVGNIESGALPNTTFLYLNEAINHYLGWNYQNIIILEGEYNVNGPIILDKTNGSDNLFARGRITIEGEGFGTRIKNDPTYTSGNIFEVRSYFNTIKNLSIISNNTNTCLALTTDNSAVDPRHNVFENLYIGVQTMVSNDDPVAGRKGITLNSSNKQIGFNRFKNITFNSVEVGVELQGALRLHDNHFENLVFENTIVGVEFLSNTDAWDNIFDNLAIQKDDYSKNLVKGVTGRHNTFTSLNHSDWGNGGQSDHKFITIADGAEHTTIQNSELGRLTDDWITDSGKYTQLINNYGGGSEITYKFGNNTTNNHTAKSKFEVLGEFISSHDNAEQITAKDGRVFIGGVTNLTIPNEQFINELNTQDPSKTYKLIVNGKVRVRNEVFVQQGGLTWPDYVFAKDYKLMPLQQVEQHIQEKGYLPNMPSAAEVEKDGIAVGDIITRQQEKIEELTLHLIEMHKKIEALEKKLNN